MAKLVHSQILLCTPGFLALCCTSSAVNFELGGPLIPLKISHLMPLYAGEGIDTGARIRKVVIIDRGMSVVNIIVLELRNLKTQIDSVESKPHAKLRARCGRQQTDEQTILRRIQNLKDRKTWRFCWKTREIHTGEILKDSKSINNIDQFSLRPSKRHHWNIRNNKQPWQSVLDCPCKEGLDNTSLGRTRA